MSRHIRPPKNRPDTTPRTPTDEALTPLLIRMLEPVGKLPAGYVYELPAFEATKLIHRRVATAVGSLGTMPDVALTEQECSEAEI